MRSRIRAKHKVTGELGGATRCPPRSRVAGRRRTQAMKQRAFRRPYVHGLETVISEKLPKRRRINPPKVVRCADDFVVLHEERTVVEQSREIGSEWLKEMGL